MRIPCYVALFCLALAACDREPTFDASSLPAYQNSLSAIKARLSEQDQRKLQLALLTLAAGSSADYTAFALANSDAPVNIEALDGVANSLNVLDRMRPSIAGKTATAVIRHVADDLDFAIARVEGQADGAEKVLAAFIVENPQYSWSRQSRSGQRTLEFSIYNGSKEPISGILVTATLTSLDHDAPLVGSNVNYHFTIPLQPGAQQRVEVLLGAPGPWTAKQIDAGDTTLRLKVSNIFKANGRRLLAADVGWLDVMRKKRDRLRGS
jgi:uncharacterized protein DUF6694